MFYDPLDIDHDFLLFEAILINNAYEIHVYILPILKKTVIHYIFLNDDKLSKTNVKRINERNQLNEQSSPGVLQVGQQPSKGTLHIPHTSSLGTSHRQTATPCQL